jgi:hypothetical protein
LQGSKGKLPNCQSIEACRKDKRHMDARKFFELAYTALIGFEVGFMVDLVAKLLKVK